MPSGKYERSPAWRAAQSRSQRHPSQKAKLAQRARRKRERGWLDLYHACLDEASEAGWEPEDALYTTIESFRAMTDEGDPRELKQPFILGLLRKYAKEVGLSPDEADRHVQQPIAEEPRKAAHQPG